MQMWEYVIRCDPKSRNLWLNGTKDVCKDVIQNQENLSPTDVGCDRMCQDPFQMRKPLYAKGPRTTNQEDDSCSTCSSFPLCPTLGAHMAQAYDKSRMSAPATTVNHSTFAFHS